MLSKMPPHSLEAEQAVLGGIFLRPESLLNIMDILNDDDFYIPAHKFIFSAIVALFVQNVPIDVVTVGEQLRKQGQLELVGNSAYLAELAHGVISAANAEYLATTVRDKAMLRNMISSCADIIGQCYDPSQEVQSILDQSEQSIFSIAQRSNKKSMVHVKDLTKKIFADLEKRFAQKEMVTGVTTGYASLDNLTAGFQPSDLIILAARPSMGKTALAMNMLMRAAVTRSKSVAVFSLEMSMDQLMMRMLCSWGKVDLSKLRRSYLEPEDWQRLQTAADVFSKSSIFIDDTPALSTLELRTRVRRLKADKGVDLVMIDYLQLMRAGRRTDSRELEISEISRSLKALAKELNIPVIALAQLNRKLEDRQDKRPILSDLRESGAIEQDADVIMFIYRDAVYNKGANKAEPGPAEIIIGKQRNGPTGTAHLTYLPSFTAFEEEERRYGDV
ncbi:replicative DNA helicase [Desulfovibrio litoralis]